VFKGAKRVKIKLQKMRWDFILNRPYLLPVPKNPSFQIFKNVPESYPRKS
jgi:hypothetical protein